MNDPHVKSLTYRLKTDASVSYDNPPALEEQFPDYSVSLKDGILAVQPKVHFSTDSEARLLVDPFLKVWELDVALKSGPGEIEFEFVSAEIIDRNPTAPGHNRTIEVGTGLMVTTGFDASLHLTRKQYPKPPTAIAFSPDVESLWKRYQGFLMGREPLLSMGYFCLSLIESSAGGRNQAAAKFHMDTQVLNKLGALTSVRGDVSEARKVNHNSDLTPLTGAEREWIKDVVKVIIRRKAEYDFDPGATLNQISMSSFRPI